MKKQLLCLIAALVLLLGLCVSALAYDSAHVFDDAQLLSEDEIGALEARCQEAEDTFGCGVYIVTTDDYSLYDGAESIEAFTEKFFLDYDLGTGEAQNGILLALSMAERDYDLCAHGETGHRAFTDYGKGVLAERYFLSEFGKDYWYDGFNRYLDGCTDFLQLDAQGEPFDRATDPERLEDISVLKWIAVIVIPLLTALIVCLIMKGKMKTARKQTHADAYIPQNGVRLTRQDDVYLTTTQTRVKIETQKSGGGTSVNSGGFSHSSGKFYKNPCSFFWVFLVITETTLQIGRQ